MIDLSLDARIRYCSSSITEILGYQPHEVKGKSCWEYFHPDEIPFAKEIESKDLHLDTAASLKYCRIKHKDGTWIGCECVFTVVHDVLVASTAIYQRGSKAVRKCRGPCPSLCWHFRSCQRWCKRSTSLLLSTTRCQISHVELPCGEFHKACFTSTKRTKGSFHTQSLLPYIDNHVRHEWNRTDPGLEASISLWQKFLSLYCGLMSNRCSPGHGKCQG